MGNSLTYYSMCKTHCKKRLFVSFSKSAGTVTVRTPWDLSRKERENGKGTQDVWPSPGKIEGVKTLFGVINPCIIRSDVISLAYSNYLLLKTASIRSVTDIQKHNDQIII